MIKVRLPQPESCGSSATSVVPSQPWRAPLRVLGYVRVSTEEQATSGLGLAAQEDAIRRQCERQGWHLVEVVRDDGASGKDLSRPGIQAALQRLADGEAEALVASRLDRISRSALDFLTLVEWARRQRVALVVLDLNLDTGTPSGEFFAGMMAQVAQLERGLIAERTRAALAVRRERGQAVGRPGVRDAAPEVAARIQKERSAGRTWSGIARGLNEDGVPTVRGGAMWRVSSVQAAAGYRRPPATRQVVALPEARPRRRAVGYSA